MFPTRTLLVALASGGLLVGAAATAGLLTAGSASASGAPAAASSPSPSASPPGQQGPGGREGGPGGMRGSGGPGFGRHGLGGHGLGGHGLGGLRGRGPVLHGEVVVGGQNGSTRTVVVQTGTVKTKGTSTITVVSTDGYSLTWTLNGDTRVRTRWSQGAVKDIAQGDTVMVQGERSGTTTTAALVAERPAGNAGKAGKPGGTPSPSPSSGT
jgi:hypothetical protein